MLLVREVKRVVLRVEELDTLPLLKSVVFARLAGIFSNIAHQQKSKVGEMISSTAKKILCFGPAVGSVGAFGGDRGETLVLTYPFVFELVVKAQARPLALIALGKGQTDGERRVQLGDGVAFAVQKGDVEHNAGQLLLVECVGNSAINVGSDQSEILTRFHCH